ncbi:hypothetical protein BDV12DRAFT_167573 [Aspergillus spectabilis]
MLPDLEKRAKAANMGDLKFETIVHRLADQDFPVFDLSKTLQPYRNNPAEMARRQKWILGAQNLYMTESPDSDDGKRRKGHITAIQSWGGMLGLRTGLSTCRPLTL